MPRCLQQKLQSSRRSPFSALVSPHVCDAFPNFWLLATTRRVEGPSQWEIIEMLHVSHGAFRPLAVIHLTWPACLSARIPVGIPFRGGWWRLPVWPDRELDPEERRRRFALPRNRSRARDSA